MTTSPVAPAIAASSRAPRAFRAQGTRRLEFFRMGFVTITEE
jgi:hypothetical protein